MREIRLSGSEGGEAKAFPTPISLFCPDSPIHAPEPVEGWIPRSSLPSTAIGGRGMTRFLLLESTHTLTRRTKIYADENIERSIVEGLRRRKIEVVSAREMGYLGEPDEFHLRKASELEAVILT